MPELPEVEQARGTLERALRGRRIEGVAAVPDPLVFAGARPDQLRRALTGRRVRAVRRHGKHLWLELDQRPWLALHFGMTGDVHVLGPGDPVPRFARLVLSTSGRRVAYSDPRRLGRVRLQHDPPAEPPISRLGPDPLRSPPAPEGLRRLLARRSGPVKAVLLDQSAFAGVGNWVADEVLYHAGIDPRRPASGLDPVEVARLRRALLAVLRRAVDVGADSRRFPRTWLFHHRWGRRKDARTGRGEPIVHATIGGRTTAFVPTRQR